MLAQRQTQRLWIACATKNARALSLSEWHYGVVVRSDDVYIALTMLSVIFLASPSSIIVLSR